MKCLRDGSKVTKQANVLHMQPHSAHHSAAQLGEGFKSTEGVTSFYLHTLFIVLGTGEEEPAYTQVR